PLFAAQPPSETLQFLHVLRDRGYADVAIEYLKDHTGDATLPADLREVWDVEMAANLWVLAAQTTDEEKAKALRGDAQKLLDDFLKKHPDHPAVGDAMASWATVSLERGVRLIKSAQSIPDKTQREKALLAARAVIEESRPRLDMAIKAFKKLLDGAGGKEG